MIKSKTMLVLLLLTAMAQGVWGWSGSGTDSSPYLITTVDEWNQLATNVGNGNTYEGKYFRLNNDIEFTDAGNSSSNCKFVGSYDSDIGIKPFQGTFDGAGHKIIGFNFRNDNDHYYTYRGLFGYIGNKGTVKNIIIKNLKIIVNGNSGVVAARNEGTIKEIIVCSSTIEAVTNALGGIAGNNYNSVDNNVNKKGIIQNCHILSDVTIKCSSYKDTKCGGIVGNNTGSYILNCSCAANISYKGSTTNNSSCYGGIAGFSDNDSSIENCLFLGDNVANIGYYGSIEGKGLSKYSHNYYTQTDIKGVTKSEANNCPNDDVTADDGAVPALRNNSDNATALGLLKNRYDFLTSKNVTNENYATNYSIRLYGRTLYKDGYWNTLCLPFDVTLSNSVLNGATVKTLESSSFGNGTLTLNFSSDESPITTITAGRPYIIKWTDGSNLEAPLFNNVAVSVLNGSTVETTKVNFIGTFSPKTLEANDNTVLYLGANSTLYYPSADVSINACRAYFQLKGLTAGDPTPSNSTQNVRAFTLNFGDGEASGIVDAKTNPSLSEWYSLSGRRYATPTALPKGVYIHNGRKVVIK